jgi:creatinine amidohydrolase
MFWGELTRAQLGDLLPEALVIVPTGATEQHGPHLPTCTDAELVTTVVRSAVAAQGYSRSVIVTPTVAIGSSDHHFPFGGTLSVSPETLIAVLLDIARSVSICGGKRLVFVNGHGGNHGPCSTAAAAASNRYDLAVAYTDYWSLVSTSDGDGLSSIVPGHAGEFETSLMMAVHPELVGAREPRHLPPTPIGNVKAFTVHSSAMWAGIDGHTDSAVGASAEKGVAWLDEIVKSLRSQLEDLARR